MSKIMTKNYYDPEGLGKRIRNQRKQLKLSQDAASRQADIPTSTLAKLESGFVTNPTVATMSKIAHALQTDIHYLIGYKK